MNPIEESLDRLAVVAGRLNQETDTLNWVIEAVESRIQSMNLGVTAWDERLLNAESEPNDSGAVDRTRGWVVGHVKIKDAWRLAAKQVCVEHGFFEGDTSCPYRNEYDMAEPIPLLRASRVVRVEAVSRLEALLERLMKIAHSYVEHIDRVKSLVTD